MFYNKVLLQFFISIDHLENIWINVFFKMAIVASLELRIAFTTGPNIIYKKAIANAYVFWRPFLLPADWGIKCIERNRIWDRRTTKSETTEFLMSFSKNDPKIALIGCVFLWQVLFESIPVCVYLGKKLWMGSIYMINWSWVFEWICLKNEEVSKQG